MMRSNIKATAFRCLFLSVVAAESQKGCLMASQSIVLPGCTEKCLFDSELHGICANNLGEMCANQQYSDEFFDRYGGCISQACAYDSDVFLFMDAWQEQCLLRNKKPVTSVPGLMNSYIRTKPASKSSAVSTSSKVESSSEVASSSQPPPPPSTSEVEISTSPTSQTNQKVLPSTTPEPSPTEMGKTPTSAVTSTSEDDHASHQPEDHPESSVHIHGTVTTTLAPAPATHPASKQSPGTKMIAATAGGGTAFLALVIGVVYIFMRRRKRRQSTPTTPDLWDPSRGVNEKPELDGGAMKHRYPETTTGDSPGTFKTAELYSDAANPMIERYPNLSPRDMTKSPNSMSSRGYERYYNSRNAPELDGGSTINRISEVDTVSPTTSPACRSPVSDTSTMQAWHPPAFSPAPTNTVSNVELHGETMVSPISELGTRTALHTSTQAELHGETINGNGDSRPTATVSVVELDATPEPQMYTAYSREPGIARNF